MSILQRDTTISGSTGGAASLALTRTNNPTPGDVMVVWGMAVYAHTLTISDNFGDGVGWTAITGTPIGAVSNNTRIFGWYKEIGSTVTGKVVTLTHSSSGVISGSATEYYSDVAATFSYQFNTATGVSATPGSGNVVLSGTGAWVACGAISTYYSNLAPGSGYTEIATNNPYREFSVVHQFFSAAATVSPNWTCTSYDYGSAQIAIKATVVGPQITGATAAPVHGSTGNTITGTSFGASQTGSAGSAIGGQAQVETAWSDTSITYTADRGINGNGIAVNAVVTDAAGVSSGNWALTGFAPPTGWTYVTLTSVWATASERLQSVADLAIGNQIEWDDPTITVDASGKPLWPPGTPDGYTFNFRVWNSGDGWGATEVATLNPAAAGVAGTMGRRKLQLKLGF